MQSCAMEGLAAARGGGGAWRFRATQPHVSTSFAFQASMMVPSKYRTIPISCTLSARVNDRRVGLFARLHPVIHQALAFPYFHDEPSELPTNSNTYCACRECVMLLSTETACGARSPNANPGRRSEPARRTQTPTGSTS